MLTLPDFSLRWVDLAQGVRVFMAPAGEAELAAAAAFASRELARVAKAVGLPEHLPRLQSADEAKNLPPEDQEARGLYFGWVASALAGMCIREWQGVAGECTAEKASALMRVEGMAGPFFKAAMLAKASLDAEGNASGGAPNGTSAAAPDTVTGAGALA